MKTGFTIASPAVGAPAGGDLIQQAIDRAASDGGTVLLSPGIWELADAIRLRSGVTLRGSCGATVLRRVTAKASALAGLLAYGQDRLLLRDPDAFTIGDGVTISDTRNAGFHATRGTLLGRDGDAWILSTRANADHDPQADACAVNAFPLIAAEDVEGAVVEDLQLDGGPTDPPMDSCRGAAVYALHARDCVIRRVTCERFAGDGFSLQDCHDCLIDACAARSCCGNGFHPGSGSRRLEFRACDALANEGMGIFFCIGVQDCLVVGGEIAGNRRHGVSLGAYDSGNRLEAVRVQDNGGGAVHLRRCDRIHAPSRIALTGCTLGPNRGADAGAEIVVQGEVEGMRVVDCRIERGPGIAGISIAAESGAVDLAGTTFTPANSDAILRLPVQTWRTER